MRVELYIYDLLVLGPGDCDVGGDSNFDRCINGGQHCVCLGISQGDDKVGELGGVILADVRDYVCSV